MPVSKKGGMCVRTRPAKTEGPQGDGAQGVRVGLQGEDTCADCMDRFATPVVVAHRIIVNAAMVVPTVARADLPMGCKAQTTAFAALLSHAHNAAAQSRVRNARRTCSALPRVVVASPCRATSTVCGFTRANDLEME